MENQNAIDINTFSQQEDSLEEFDWDFDVDNLLSKRNKPMLPSQEIEVESMPKNGGGQSVQKNGGGQPVQPHDGSDLIHQKHPKAVSGNFFRVEPFFSSICTTIRGDQPAWNATNSIFNNYIQQEPHYGNPFPQPAVQVGAIDGSSTQVKHSHPDWPSPNQFTDDQYEPMPKQGRGTSSLNATGAVPEYNPSQYAFEVNSILNSQTQQGTGGGDIGATVTHQFESSPSNGHRRKGGSVEEWVPLGLNFQEGNTTAAHSLGNECQDPDPYSPPIPTGIVRNGPYDPIYAELGLPVDPHLRMFMAKQQKGKLHL
ncbi:hypothetical protein F0562_027385 [Nyssa sinensis]|uniref:Uncharacterized protein n=1 Tax=Nyssa sinensis TaxID=561372 RepID=A0A5J5B451_9ASTE|nr:hypothetical protein F0562_027385 [Nyssa sinensis]